MGLRGWILMAVVGVLGCGDNVVTPTLKVVGHSDLSARGMNSALAIAGNVAYVGSRNDAHGIQIVDISDVSHPTVVGELAPPVTGLSTRELRAIDDLDLLFVLTLPCSVDLHGCMPSPSGIPNIALYDISDRRTPALLATYAADQVLGNHPTSHEMFVWRDPVDRSRVLVFATMSSGASMRILDASARTLTPVIGWDVVRDGKLDGTGANNDIHSITVSDDGQIAFISHQTGGLALVDVSEVTAGGAAPTLHMITPPADVFRWPAMVMGAHSAVPLAERPYLVVTEEVYPMPYSVGCPWGLLRTVDITNPGTPVLAGEFGLPENDRAQCAALPTTTAYTAHNVTTTQNLALVTWYAGGLQVLDVADPTQPAQLVELRPDPIPAVEREDPVLGGAGVEMWSYPVIVNGLIYVVDVRNGLYVLRYDGPHAEEIAGLAFREGNSNVGR